MFFRESFLKNLKKYVLENFFFKKSKTKSFLEKKLRKNLKNNVFRKIIFIFF